MDLPLDSRTAGTDPPDGGRPYRVLARKYRPATFGQLIGQEALVRTLTNAIRSGRVAHAFVLTGVRGVGKTSTARILARALNCIGPDGTGGPTPEPCGQCEPCRAIAADRHVDVIEMDAASRTGVDDIREIIDGVRYGPVSARVKVYIIDEVHMLSKNAFNALLKTLEEPPPHVKFVFATTEIRRVPVTVLSRCQRFDLRRVPSDRLSAHFTAIAEQEAIAAEPEAIGLIARAADGSVRDGLSLLDQAIAQSDGAVTAAHVRAMLGMADRTRLIDLYEAVLGGRAAPALAMLDELHAQGAEPLAILQDLLELTHLLSRAKLVPGWADNQGLPEAERVRGAALAAGLGMPVLARAWQMLLKGIEEVQAAPAPQAALEMVLIRLIHSAGLPTPGDLIRQLEDAPGGGETGPAIAAPRNGPAPLATAAISAVPSAATPIAAALPARPPAAPEPPPARPAQPGTPLRRNPRSFPELVRLFETDGDTLVYSHLKASVHLVRFEPGRLEIALKEGAPRNLISQLTSQLQQWTGERWIVSVTRAAGEPTLADQERLRAERAKAEAASHPLVKAVLETFPGASIRAVRELGLPEPAGAPDDAPAGDAEDWQLDQAGDG